MEPVIYGHQILRPRDCEVRRPDAPTYYLLFRTYSGFCSTSRFYIYVVPTGMEEAPKAALNIHCLQRGGGAALIQTINLIPPPRGDGGAWALAA